MYDRIKNKIVKTIMLMVVAKNHGRSRSIRGIGYDRSHSRRRSGGRRSGISKDIICIEESIAHPKQGDSDSGGVSVKRADKEMKLGMGLSSMKAPTNAKGGSVSAFTRVELRMDHAVNNSLKEKRHSDGSIDCEVFILSVNEEASSK